MKIFLSYRFTGEDHNVLYYTLKRIVGILEKNGHNVFCSFFKEEYFQKNNFTSDQIYDYCNKELSEYDRVLFLIRTHDESKGMQFELGEAIKHDKKIVLAIADHLNFNEFRDNAHEVIDFKDIDILYEILKTYQF